ncbi:MAG: hypothetical protein Ct9H90mP6_10760 [Gammaproteobacteria bacterium]|nr:MAG: hypothetical protein Ct9H90mP6_10760 [Gammaproteobacteria bacterium]
MRPEDIAYRSITTALSDLGGMGSFPSFISIALTSDIEEIPWYEKFSKGIKETLDEFSLISWWRCNQGRIKYFSKCFWIPI